MLNRMQAIIRDNDMCVLATTNGCKPHTSLMTYLPGNDGISVYMVTGKSTRKHDNILTNQHVSLLIDTRLQRIASPNRATVALTLQGVATILETPDNVSIYSNLLNKNTTLKDIGTPEHTAIIHVQIQSLQLLDGVADMHVIQI